MATSPAENRSVYQLFVKQFDGKTLNLRFTTPTLSAETLIGRIRTLVGIPDDLLYLVSQNRLLRPETLIVADPGTRLFPSVSLVARLLGGKGGFGSLLRGAATKAGHKKTNNFDACRDMSGRRLRHVNAEKKLEEWKEGEEERRLEKIAEDFLKKKAKSHSKGGGSRKGDSAADKYVAKYREDSAKCVAEVDSAVREAFERERKRKGVLEEETVDSKKLKIWLGKKKVDDMEDDSSEEEEEDGKSTVINNQDSPNKDDHHSPSSISDGDHSYGETQVAQVENSDAVDPQEVVDQILDKVPHADEPQPQAVEANTSGGAVQTDGISESSELEADVKATSNIGISAPMDDGPLNFDDYSTAAAMEVLGMDRLKSELQARGLKCGGTLQERAARLFLLKTTPIEKLPKKLLVKK
uniref:Uncharacterized protein n=1 Tax=Kalanchoe fedtschenkoi TaxID=63787 RepID=A0A7N0UAW8_KALFE